MIRFAPDASIRDVMKLNPKNYTGLTGVSFALTVIFLCAALPAWGETGRNLSGRIEIDGFPTHEGRAGEIVRDFEDDEQLFGQVTRLLDGRPIVLDEEPNNDSKWGFNNDINQIKVTWDAENIYVAVDGISWDNNIILLMDYLPGGLEKMTELNSWRRNFVFSNGFRPDLFLATWDGNTTPQLWRASGENTVVEIDNNTIETEAKFDQSITGRSMEAAIPWDVFYADGLTRFFDESVRDSSWLLPGGLSPSRPIRFCAIVTAGADGTGGPDSAPDNFSGHTIESSDQVSIDNYAIVPLDTTFFLTESGRQIYDVTDTFRLDTTEVGGGIVVDTIPDPVVDTILADGAPDLQDVRIKNRVRFLADPPVRGITFAMNEISFDRPILSPEEGDELRFWFTLDPSAESIDERDRNVTLTAEIYNMRGLLVKTLYREIARRIGELVNSESNLLDENRWDGLDDSGHMVPGGIYLLRLVIEPGVSSEIRGFSVVR